MLRAGYVVLITASLCCVPCRGECESLIRGWQSPSGWVCGDFEEHSPITCAAHGATLICCECSGGTTRLSPSPAPALGSESVDAFNCVLKALIDRVGCLAPNEICIETFSRILEAAHTWKLDTTIKRLSGFISTIFFETNLLSQLDQEIVPLSKEEWVSFCESWSFFRISLGVGGLSQCENQGGDFCECVSVNDFDHMKLVGSQSNMTFQALAWYMAEGLERSRSATHGCENLRVRLDEGYGSIDCLVNENEYSPEFKFCSSGFHYVVYCLVGHIGPTARLRERMTMYTHVQSIASRMCGYSPSPLPLPTPSPSSAPDAPPKQPFDLTVVEWAVTGAAAGVMTVAMLVIIGTWVRRRKTKQKGKKKDSEPRSTVGPSHDTHIPFHPPAQMPHQQFQPHVTHTTPRHPYPLHSSVQPHYSYQ